MPGCLRAPSPWGRATLRTPGIRVEEVLRVNIKALVDMHVKYVKIAPHLNDMKEMHVDWE